MTFTAAAGLLVLGGVPLIVWWHLRRLWHRRVVVASLEPWRLAVKAAPRPRRVPRTVLLALHLAVAILAGLAAAGPRWGRGAAPGHVAVVVDASASMGEGRRWDRAVTAAEESIRPGAITTVVRAGTLPRVVALRAQDRAASEALGNIVPGDAAGDLTAAVALARGMAGPGAETVVVTDRPAPPEMPVGVKWMPVMADQEPDNVAVIAAGVWTPGAGASVEASFFARVANFGRIAAAVPYTVSADGAVVAADRLALGPGQGVSGTWSLPPGAKVVTLALAPGDTNPTDDVVSAPVAKDLPRVQLVGDSPAMARALAALGNLAVASVGRATYFTDGRADVSVFAGHVPAVLPAGGVIIVAPPPGTLFTAADDEEYVTLPASADHPLAAGIDFEAARVSSPAGLVVPPWADPVLHVGDRVLAFAGARGESRVVVFGFDPDAPESGIRRREAFPVLIARAMAWALDPQPGVMPAGAVVPLPPGAFAVRGPAGRTVTAVGGFFATAGPGLYSATRGGVATKALLFGVAAGNAAESDLGRRHAPDLATGDPLRGASSTAPQRGRGRPMGSFLAAGAVAVLLLEGWWRSEGSARRGGPPSSRGRG